MAVWVLQSLAVAGSAAGGASPPRGTVPPALSRLRTKKLPGWGGPDRGGLLRPRRVHPRSSYLVRRGHRCAWSPLADTQRALRLLEEYRSKLSQAEDRQLRNSIERVISIFQSNLFQALIGKG